MNQCLSCLVWFEPPAGDEDKTYCCKAHEPTLRQRIDLLEIELMEPDYDDDDLLPEG